MTTTCTKTEGVNGTYYETGCIEIEGKSFCAMGGMLGINPKTGKRGGVCYAYGELRDSECNGFVGGWEMDGKRYPAYFGKVWRSNFGDNRRSVWFRMDGRNYQGIQYMGPDWAGFTLIRFKEVK